MTDNSKGKKQEMDMKQNKNIKSEYVKKNTMLLISIITLFAGFLGGIVYSDYKTGRKSATNNSQTSQNISSDLSSEMFQLEKKTMDNPDDVDSWIKLGNIHFDTNNYEKAITAYNQSLKILPRNADVLTDLGVMYQRSGRPEIAIQNFEKAMEVNPRHETSRLNKGIVLFYDLNDKDGALKAWEELLEMNPNAKTAGGQLVSELVKQVKNKK
jgi:cytochrome c-type biogenesis protein CcmH/NrfG